MPPSFAMWRMLPPWQNLSNGAIVSLWPCMPGFHCCSLGLHTPTCKVVRHVVPPETLQCPHHRSGQFWLTAFPLAIIFSLLLISVGTQDFTVVNSNPSTQLQIPLDQRVHIGFPPGTSVSSSVSGNLGRILNLGWFTIFSFRNNHSSPSGRSHGQTQEDQATKPTLPRFRKLSALPNRTCPSASQCKDVDCGHEHQESLCSERLVHIAMTLDVNYLRGSMAAIYSILLHAECPSNIRFHFVTTEGKEELEKVVAEALPFLRFQTYTFDEKSVKSRISHAVRHALEEPLNYARFYMAHMIDPCVKRIIYLDSDVLVLDRIEELWTTDMGNSTIGTPEYCHANFHSYFTENFWNNFTLSSTFANKRPCYFNSGVMVINLDRWRRLECTATLENWMEVQKEQHIYDLGSLPPLLLTFAGDIQPIDNRWNQHGLGGDIFKGDCRPTRNEPASLLHWSGGGKPWQRIDIQQPCPIDSIWVQYDLLEPTY